MLLVSACGSGGPASPAETSSNALQPFELRLGEEPERRYFGHAVALADDAAVIGAWGDSTRGEASGAAFVFSGDDVEWQLRDVLYPDANEPGQFGYSVAAHGEILAVGAVFDPEGGERAGAAHVYRWSSGQWSLESRLVPDRGYAYYGRALQIENDTLVVGAPGPAAGYVDVLRRTEGEWRREARIAPGVDADVRFGAALALDGDRLLVGAWSDAPEAPGRAYLYARTGAEWRLRAEFEDLEDSDYGRLVALQGDTLAIGGHGGVTVFEEHGAAWREAARLVGDDDSSSTYATDVVLHEGSLFVGAPATSAGEGASGAVHVYRRSGGRWLLDSALRHEEPGFGSSLAVNERALLVGATGDGRNDAAFLYPLDATTSRSMR